jgi:hypothetical protein
LGEIAAEFPDYTGRTGALPDCAFSGRLSVKRVANLDDNALRHHSRSERTTPRGRFRRRARSSRDLCQRRDRRDFHQGGFRDAPRGASSLCHTQHSPPPVQRSHRRSDATCREPRSCILGVTSDFATTADFKPTRFLVLLNPWHDLPSAVSRGVIWSIPRRPPARQNTPVPFQKGPQI